jgi:histidine triad (HIT) family protein
MVGDCLFCKMAAGTVPVPKVYEDAEYLCIRDIRPQARIHLLVMPKEHVASLEAAFPDHGPARSEMVGRLFEIAARIARQQGLLPDGFRSVINTNSHGGQTVFHLHLHLLGGEPLGGAFA